MKQMFFQETGFCIIRLAPLDFQGLFLKIIFDGWIVVSGWHTVADWLGLWRGNRWAFRPPQVQPLSLCEPLSRRHYHSILNKVIT